MLVPGSRIGERFLVEGLVSEGGTAAVYRVRHTRLGTVYALKLLTPRSPLPAERLLREGRIQAGLQHPCIVNVLDVLDVDGGYGLVMEFVDGPTLAAVREILPYPVVQVVFADVLGGVASAHEQGILHRDLKPQNVLMAPVPGGWMPKVADFGIARLAREGGGSGTRVGFGMGTPGYVAPEQRRDAASVDQRVDVYSLGVVLYELLTHRLPFGLDPEPGAIFVPVDGVPPHVNEALEAMLAVDPDGRPDSVAAVAALLFPDDADLRDVAAGRLPPRPVPLEGVLRPNTDAGVAQTLLPDSDPNLTMIPTPAAAVSPPLTVVSAGRRWGPLVGAMLVLLLGVGIATVGTLDEPAPAVVAPRVVPPPEAGATNVSEVPVVNPGAAAGGVPGVEAGPGAMAAPRAVPAPAAVAAAPEGEVASVASPGATALPAAALGSAAVATPAPVVEAVVVQPVAAPSAPPEAAVPAVAAPTGEWTGTAGGRPFVLRLSGGTSALQADVTVTLGITDRTSRYAGRMGTDGLVVLLEVDGTGRIEGRFGASSGRGSLMVGKGKPLTWEVGR